MTNWHEQDDFWITMGPSMFTEDHWKAASTEVDQIITLVKGLSLDGEILDRGCGPGRHALAFSRRGYSVTGVDRTAAFLEEARTRATEEGLTVAFILGDMREVRRTASFDLALSLFTTFGYFKAHEDNVQVLRNIFESLKAHGSLVLELMGKEVLARIFQERDWFEVNGVLYLFERKIEQNWRWIQNRWIKIDGSNRSEFALGHWVYAGAELHDLLKEVGFSDVNLYGGLDGSPYDHTAGRLVAVARQG